MSIKNPLDLVDEFKKSGRFDALRQQLLADFQSSERAIALSERVNDIARGAESRLAHLPPQAARRGLMAELDRYPVVERAVTDTQPTSLAQTVRDALADILRTNRRAQAEAVTPLDSVPSSPMKPDGCDPSPSSYEQHTSALKPSLNGVNHLDPSLSLPAKPSLPPSPSRSPMPGTSPAPLADPRAVDAPSAIRVASPTPPPMVDVPMVTDSPPKALPASGPSPVFLEGHEQGAQPASEHLDTSMRV